MYWSARYNYEASCFAKEKTVRIGKMTCIFLEWAYLEHECRLVWQLYLVSPALPPGRLARVFWLQGFWWHGQQTCCRPPGRGKLQKQFEFVAGNCLRHSPRFAQYCFQGSCGMSVGWDTCNAEMKAVRTRKDKVFSGSVDLVSPYCMLNHGGPDVLVFP